MFVGDSRFPVSPIEPEGGRFWQGVVFDHSERTPFALIFFPARDTAVSPAQPQLKGRQIMQPDDIDIAHAEQARKESPFLTTAEAGTYVGLSRRTLEKMRTAGNGPIYRKHGRYVRYHIADLDAWSTSHRKNSTSEKNSHAPSPHRERPAIRETRGTSCAPKGKSRRRA